MSNDYILKENYQNWLINEKKLSESTAKDYVNALANISKHYSKNQSEINLFLLDDINKLKEIVTLYKDGRYSNYARQGSGSRLASLHQYYEFIAGNNKIQINSKENSPQVWVYSPGPKAKYWEAFYRKGIMAINSDGLGDLRQYASSEERIAAYRELEKHGIYANKPKEKKDPSGRIKENTLIDWSKVDEQILNTIKTGDLIIAKKGRTRCIGYGFVKSDYFLDESPDKDSEHAVYDSCRKVEWHKIEPIENAGFDFISTLNQIDSKEKYSNFIENFKKIYIYNRTNTMQINHKNTILYGPPGTGKTYAVVEKALKIIDKWKPEYETEEGRKKAVTTFNGFIKAKQIEFVTFHQSYSYEEFIEGIKPEKDDIGISYPVKDGVFKRIALRAQGKDSVSFEDAIEKLKQDCDESEGKSIIIQTSSSSFTITYRGGITFRVKPTKSVKPDHDYPASIENIKKLYFSEATRKDVYNPTYVTGILDKLYEYGLPKLNIEPKGDENLNYVVVIDEINRGNISKIFGELITLIEDDKRIGAENETIITLPYSEEQFGVPQNLYIIGTMNTADRSIALMDTALRRRFNFEAMMPEYDKLDFKVGQIEIKPMLESINSRISRLYDRDHQIGHAYFLPLKKDNSKERLCEIFLNKIIPLLQEYFYDDWEKIQVVLGDHNEQKNPDKFKFIIAKELDDKNLFGFSYLNEESGFIYSINEEIKNNKISDKAFIKIYQKITDDDEN